MQGLLVSQYALSADPECAASLVADAVFVVLPQESFSLHPFLAF